MSADNVERKILRWSTDVVEPSQRFDYYSDALSTALTPMQVRARSDTPRAFTAETRSAALGSVDVLCQTGDASEAHRESRDISRSQAHSYHLIVNLAGPFAIRHRGDATLFQGDAVFTDSNYGHELILGQYDVINLRFDEQWIRAWVPSPGVLTGRKIIASSSWARALIAFVTQLSPEFVVRAPLPQAVIADQIGALLALVAHESSGALPVQSRVTRALNTRAEEIISQRCGESGLSAECVALALHISKRTLHRSLAAAGATFGGILQKARIDAATRMLDSPLFKRITIAEIGRRAGFSDASHFSRAFKSRTGITPVQHRLSM